MISFCFLPLEDTAPNTKTEVASACGSINMLLLLSIAIELSQLEYRSSNIANLISTFSEVPIGVLNVPLPITPEKHFCISITLLSLAPIK